MLFRCFFVVVFISGIALGKIGYDELLQKYGIRKIYESCFGQDLMEEKFKEFTNFVGQCKNDSVSGQTTKRVFDWHAALSSAGSHDTPLYLPVPIITQGRKSPFFFNKRQKRGAYFNEAKLRKLKNNVLQKLKIACCVLEKMNILDGDMNIQWNELEKMYTKDYGFERELREDLQDMFTTCKNLVMCMPFEDKPGEFPLGLKQIIQFKKCEKMETTAACIKKDLRRKPEMFELEGLDGMMDHYEEDDDKMLRVLKLYNKYGDDDAKFFY